MHGGCGAVTSGAPRRLRRCGELATGHGAGVTVSQKDLLTGTLSPLRLYLGKACCRSQAETQYLLTSPRSAAVICGTWVAGEDSPMGGVWPGHGG